MVKFNVILLTVDCLRSDYVDHSGCNVNTPNIKTVIIIVAACVFISNILVIYKLCHLTFPVAGGAFLPCPFQTGRQIR